jgi:hypothetical protein
MKGTTTGMQSTIERMQVASKAIQKARGWK